MNTIGISLVWCVLQVSFACVTGAGVYLVAKRTDRAAGRLTTIATLMLVLALSATALSPWPSWLSSSLISGDAFAHLGPSEGDRGLQSDYHPTTRVDGKTSELSASSTSSDPFDMAFWQVVWSDLSNPQRGANYAHDLQGRMWSWSSIVVGLLIATSAAGLIRLLVAVLALRRLDRRSTTIRDRNLIQLAASISRELRPARAVVLKETCELQTAATFGWRHPVLLMPAAWRGWRSEELRAVLAHEFAHIAARDSSKWMLAQLAVAIHFYHPLVHWLAGRLRLEQELSADAMAASISGGRQKYLQCLATLTLRADRVSANWATQTFLPTRTLFVRRIEMLKTMNFEKQETYAGRPHLAIIGTLLMIGILALGLRAPNSVRAQLIVAETPSDSRAQPSKIEPTESENTESGYDFGYVPDDFLAMVAVRPAEMASSAHLATLAKLLEENTRPSMPAEALQQVTLAIVPPQFSEQGQVVPGTGGEYTIFRTNRSIDFKERLSPTYGPMATNQHQSLEYWTWGSSPSLLAFHSPNDRTLLCRVRAGLFSVMDNPKASQPPTQASKWQKQATGPLFGIANIDAFREMNKGRISLPGGAVWQSLAPVLTDVDHVTFAIVGEEALTLKVNAICSNAQQVSGVEKTVQSVLVLVDNLISAQSLVANAQSGDDALAIKELLSLASTIIKNVKLTSAGSQVTLTVPLGNLQSVLESAVPRIQAGRRSAIRSQSQNHLRQIALAFHMYHDAHGHFPPAVLYDKETGTPYSWRVAILPYLEQKALYDRYRFGEPWDSEHNKQVLALQPIQYSSSANQISRYSSYFVLTGPETVFTGSDGVKISQITDGASKTLLVVEAKREIPWTKPEDIPYSSERPLPTLGGNDKGGFLAAYCDASVRIVSDEFDEQAIRRLIEKAD